MDCFQILLYQLLPMRSIFLPVLRSILKLGQSDISSSLLLVQTLEALIQGIYLGCFHMT